MKPAVYRLTDTADPEERLEDAALFKALHDEFGDDLQCGGTPPPGSILYGRRLRAEPHAELAYWSDMAFLAEAGRQFTVCAIDDVPARVAELHRQGLGAFIKSTRSKHVIFRVPVGEDPTAVIGDMGYSFIDGGPALMVQELADITHEFRFFAMDRSIVADSPNAVPLTPIDYPCGWSWQTPEQPGAQLPAYDVRTALMPVAARIAATMRTPDAVIDCAFINGVPGCVELNPLALGNVGLFACDVRAIARAARRLHAIRNP